MGSPKAVYQYLLVEYVQNAIKDNETLVKQYSEDYLYSIPEKDLEEIVKNINPDHPIYNAMMAGAIMQSFMAEAYNDELNAFAGCLQDYCKLFGVDLSTDSYKKNQHHLFSQEYNEAKN